jgi:nitric oxide reductase activation protein
MVDNIHVTVSFRSTKNIGGIEMPYIVQAYDSKKDKFSKVKNLFRFLKPCGYTPEGLAYGAIMDLFVKSSPDEQAKYFFNISDGEPWISIHHSTGKMIHYGDGNGVEHTRNQVTKIRRCGINILSYYIQNENAALGNHDTKKNFQIMYGKDARFLDITDVTKLALSINNLFLNNSPN